jgi:hypothetical protein
LAAEALLVKPDITVDEVRDGELHNADSIQSGSQQGREAYRESCAFMALDIVGAQ